MIRLRKTVTKIQKKVDDMATNFNHDFISVNREIDVAKQLINEEVQLLSKALVKMQGRQITIQEAFRADFLAHREAISRRMDKMSEKITDVALQTKLKHNYDYVLK